MTHELAMDRSIDPQIRRMYAHVLTRWAADLLELRRRGLDVPGDSGADLSMPWPGEHRDGRRGDRIRIKA